jgi:small-conductance mechanosensitive channel
MTTSDWLDRVLLGNPLRDWGLAILGAVLATTLVALLRGTVVRRLEIVAARTATSADDFAVALIKAIRSPLVVAAALGVATRFLALPNGIDRIARWLIVGAAVLQAIAWVNASVTFWIRVYEDRTTGAADRTALSVFSVVARIVLWAAVAIVALDVLGLKPTTLITTLGVGGIAIALAVQNVLGDLFGAFSIILDKPFLVGDAIAVDTIEGTVEHIGLKTTRVRSVNGEQIIISNADLLRSRVRNNSRRQGRRLVFTLSIAPGTPAAKLARVPEIVADVVAAEARADLQRSHVNGMGTLGFEVETSINVPHPDYKLGLDVRQAILLGIYARLEQERISLALPAAAQPIPPAPAAPPGA